MELCNFYVMWQIYHKETLEIEPYRSIVETFFDSLRLNAISGARRLKSPPRNADPSPKTHRVRRSRANSLQWARHPGVPQA
jgi:hypothetical protein